MPLSTAQKTPLSHRFVRPRSQAAPADEPTRLTNLDLLRILLAMEVLIGHVYTIRTNGSNLLLPIPAVPGFICLSGFLIPASLARSRGYGHFARKRALRVLPAFVVSLALVVILFGKEGLPPTLRFYVLLGLGAQLSYNPPLWSLMLEELLYAFHALSVKLRAWGLPLVVLLGSALLATWIYLEFTQPPLPEGFERIPPAVIAFFVGNLIYLLRERLMKVHWHTYVVSMGATLFFRSLLEEAAPLWLFSPIVSGLALILALILPQVRFRIEDISYGIYIYHYPFILFANGVPGLPRSRVFGITLTATLCLSWMSWIYLEKRMLALKNR